MYQASHATSDTKIYIATSKVVHVCESLWTSLCQTRQNPLQNESQLKGKAWKIINRRLGLARRIDMPNSNLQNSGELLSPNLLDSSISESE